MSLEFRLDKGNDKHVKYLFEHAFPLIERPPYSRLGDFQNNEMYGIYEKDNFIGLVDLSFNEDVIYIFFLAIRKALRHQGYGSKILSEIFNKYKGYKFYLLMEEIDDKYINNLERKARLSFYLKNGLKQNHIKMKEYQVIYEMMVSDDTLMYQDHLNMMNKVLTKYYPIYLKNIKEIKE